MAKFLNSDGLTRLVALIKQALGGKKDADLIVTITQSGSTYTSDKTYAEIVAAKDAGKTVLMTYGNVFYSLKRIISSYAQFDALDGALTRIDIFYVKSNGTVERSNTPLQTPLTFDQLPTQGSSNPVWSAGVYYSLGQKQDTLVSGTNIKTVNSTSLLGSGDIAVQAPLTFDTTPTANSTNPVTSGGIKSAIDVKQDENFVVAFTTSSNVYSADKTFAATYAAYNAGKNVICTAPTELGTSVGSVSLIAADIVVFTIPWDDGTDAYIDVYYFHEDDSVDFVSKRVQKKLTFDQTPKAGSLNPVASRGIKTALDGKQDTLVSGTNIKTINSTSLLGSGNLDLTKKIEYSTTASMEADSSQPNGTIGYDAEEENWYIYDMPNGEWRRIDIEEPNEIASITTNESSVSGGNNTVMITETNGTTHTFNVKNGIDGQDGADGANGVSLGEVAIADDQTTDDATKVLSARQGKLLGDDVSRLKDYEFGVKTYDENDLFKNKSYTNGGTTAGKRMTALSNFGCIKIPVTKGDKLTIATSGASGARAYSLCDEELAIYLVSSSGKDTTSNPDTISVTKDGYCHINCKSSAYANFGVTHYYSLERQMLTDNTRSLTQGEMDGTSDWIRDKLEALGWEFDQYVKGNTGTTAANDNYCASPFIPVSEIKGHSITFCYMFNAWSTGALCFYNSSKTFISGAYYGSNVDNLRTITIPTSSSWNNIAYLRFTCNSDRLSGCYIYDNTDEVYIWKGDEYLGTIYENNLVSYKTFRDVLVSQESGKSTLLTMSQKAITEQFDTSVFEGKKPTYFRGTLSGVNFVDNPEFDITQCHGITIIVPRYNTPESSRYGFLNIIPTNYSNHASTVYAVSSMWGALKTGLMSNYYGTLEEGANLGSGWRNCSHLVITVDFETGQTKVYTNGVLTSTVEVNAAYSYQDIQTYFSTCNRLYLSCYGETMGGVAGIALFGSVLTDSDISEIYGGGYESALYQTVPEKWKANRIAPIIYDNTWTLYGSGFTSTRDDSGMTLTRTGSTVYFGFTGLSGTIGNVIYEWSFEVLSGSATTYSRGMIYNNNYYKIFTILDEEDNDVSYGATISTGHSYRVVAKPDNLLVGTNAGSNRLLYTFGSTSEDFVLRINPILRIQERGAGFICDVNNFRGTYWEQTNGYHSSTNDIIYEARTLQVMYDTFKPNVGIYSSSAKVQFNGQIAIDTINGKIYMGYLTGTGGTWKQINNS